MEKRQYKSPVTRQLNVETFGHLLDWSAEKVPEGGGGNTPGAKRNSLFNATAADNSMPIWDY